MKLSHTFLLTLTLIAPAALFAAFTQPAPAFASDPTPIAPKRPSLGSSPAITRTYFFPLVYGPNGPDPCAAISGQNYNSIAPTPPPTDRPADQHADLNLALRWYIAVDKEKYLIDYSGPTDSSAPQLATLFATKHLPAFSNTYQVGHWDWGCNCRDRWDDEWPVELLGMSVSLGQVIDTPIRNVPIGTRAILNPLAPYEAMVLYATDQRITLKYTLEDNVVFGYTIHVENVCVEPNLLALYNNLNAAGRSQLPALSAGQPFGRSRGNEIRVAIRDTGTFMDPRSRKDWWQGY